MRFLVSNHIRGLNKGVFWRSFLFIYRHVGDHVYRATVILKPSDLF